MDKEKRGFSESSLRDPQLFLSELRDGLVYPGITDIIILLHNNPFNLTTNIVLLHYYRVGSKSTDVQNPIYVIGNEPSKSLKTDQSTYSFLIRKKSNPESQELTYYSALIGYRGAIKPYLGSFNYNTYEITQRINGRIVTTSKTHRWVNVMEPRWIQKYILRIK